MDTTYETGSAVAIEQVLQGAGVFNGNPLGYARLAYSQGGAAFTVRFERMAAAGNDHKLEVADAGVDRASTSAVFDAARKTLTVFPKRVGGVLTGTAAEAVTAIAALGRKCPIKAALVTDAALTAAAATALADGVDPVVAGGKHVVTGASGKHGGLFCFDQQDPWEVTAILARFADAAGAFTANVSIVEVDAALNVVAGRQVRLADPKVYAGTPYHYALINLRVPLLPGEAILVEGAAGGMARVVARREPRSV